MFGSAPFGAISFGSSVPAGPATATMGGGNWSSASTWVSGKVPTAADDVLLTSISGSVTVDATSVCRSLDCNGYAGTLTLNAFNLSIGDSAVGIENRALRLSSGMTVTANTSSTLKFASTNATQQTVATLGKTVGIITFDGSGGSWILSDSLSAYSLQLTRGSFDSGNNSITATASISGSGTQTRSVTLGSSTVTVNSSTGWGFSTTTNLTFSAGTSQINLTASGATFDGGGLTYNSVSITGAGAANLLGTNTFASLTRTGTAVKTCQLIVQANQVITGTLTLSGNSVTNRLHVYSSPVGTQRTLTAATVSCSNVDLEDMNGSGAGSWNLSSISGNSGDCGGNSGITFTSPSAQSWSGTSGGNWSTNAWSGRVPLPQDDVSISAAFSASQTVTADMPRLGKSIDWTSANAVTWGFSSTTTRIYGSLTLTSNVTISGTVSTIFCGHANFSITSAGRTWTQDLTFNHAATATLQDDLNLGTKPLYLTTGTLDTNGKAVTCGSLNSTQNASRTLTLGASTVSLGSTGTVISFTNTSLLTVNCGTSTIRVTDTSSSSKTLTAAGFTYYDLLIDTGGTGAVIIQGSNSWNSIAVTGGGTKTINFTSSTTQTLRGGSGSFVQGASGNLITVQSVTSGTPFTLSSSTAISTDYISLKDCTASGSTPFYAGANSTNVSGNTNWSFTAPGGSGSLLTYLSRLRSLTGGTA